MTTNAPRPEEISNERVILLFITINTIDNIVPIYSWKELLRISDARWFRTAKNRDVSNRPLTLPLARSLAPLARSAALNRSLAPLTHSLPSSWESVIFFCPRIGLFGTITHSAMMA